MKKNKLIALGIVAFLILVPFQWAYLNISKENQLIQVFCMVTVILGSIVAIFMFNKNTGESSH